MELKVLEEKKDMLSLELTGETHTFLNLLTEVSWKEGARQAAYFVEHPYIAQPKIIVRSDNPRRVLRDSVQKIIDDCEDFSTKFKRAMKK